MRNPPDAGKHSEKVAVGPLCSVANANSILFNFFIIIFYSWLLEYSAVAVWLYLLGAQASIFHARTLAKNSLAAEAG